jgi:serine/threonine protein kinase
LALEYVEGPTLFELITKPSKLPIDICLFIAKELAKAIAAVHRYNILHLDVKPHNIFISFAGSVKLGDLGLARELVDTTNLIAGTPAYMAPEQVLGLEITKASDLFSFGAVFYEMLTGEAAFAHHTLSATLHHVANWDPLPITLLRPDAPADLVSTCQKLLAKNSAERFRDAQAVVDHLSWLERRYGLNTTAKHLADFIEAPQAYRKVDLQQVPEIPVVVAETKRLRTPSLSWGMAAVVSGMMFLAGVVYIIILKDRVQSKAAITATGNIVSAPLQYSPDLGASGYLDLRVMPWGVVRIDGETLGKTPLAKPIELPAGKYRVMIEHPRFGAREIAVQIGRGDTLRQSVDLTKP